jgi:hypothetical protein
VQVSWIRTSDLHILTWGTLTYTSDSRFEALHTPGSEVWTLRIMSAQPRDQGKYECQVNTDPKLNFAVLLTVKGTNFHSDFHNADYRANVNFMYAWTKYKKLPHNGKQSTFD